jgi:hypothetical protein
LPVLEFLKGEIIVPDTNKVPDGFSLNLHGERSVEVAMVRWRPEELMGIPFYRGRAEDQLHHGLGLGKDPTRWCPSAFFFEGGKSIITTPALIWASKQTKKEVRDLKLQVYQEAPLLSKGLLGTAMGDALRDTLGIDGPPTLVRYLNSIPPLRFVDGWAEGAVPAGTEAVLAILNLPAWTSLLCELGVYPKFKAEDVIYRYIRKDLWANDVKQEDLLYKANPGKWSTDADRLACQGGLSATTVFLMRHFGYTPTFDQGAAKRRKKRRNKPGK